MLKTSAAAPRFSSVSTASDTTFDLQARERAIAKKSQASVRKAIGQHGHLVGRRFSP